jgi:hypothetical membrane protein
MHTKSRGLSNWSSGLGFLSALFACWLGIYREGYGRLAWPLLVAGFISMFIGFVYYVRAKGYHPAWAFLLFVFGPTVYFVFFLLPDRYEQAQIRDA